MYIEELRSYLGTIITDIKSVENTDDLIEKSLIRSLALSEILFYIESHFQIQIEGDYFDIENFRTIEKMNNIIEIIKGDRTK